jgi:hypothetical protein
LRVAGVTLEGLFWNLTKERQRQTATIAVLALALGLALARQNGWRVPSLLPAPGGPSMAKQAPGPRDVIYAMLAAARDGDVNAYLASYTGQMETVLQASVRETTPDGFARYLRDSNAGIKGVAITEPEPLSGSQVKVRVEYVYQDRNEAQTIYLDKVDGAWRIARVDAAERVKTLVPYGTQVQ